MIQIVTKYWVQQICVLFTAMFGFIWKYIKSIAVKEKALQGGVLGLLRDRINQSCKYHFQKGYISSSDYQVLKSMFKQYKAMGGNGIVGHLQQRIDNLELRVDVFQ